MKKLFLLLLFLICILSHSYPVHCETIWQIGNADDSGAEFALASNNYSQFIENDFGWEDRFFLIGRSSDQVDWPYVLPGPSDQWGGTGGTSGWRSHTLTILFDIEERPENGVWTFVVDLFDIHPKAPPIFKINFNGKTWKFALPAGSGDRTIEGESMEGHEHLIKILIPETLIKRGGNAVSMTSIRGSWLLFDQIRLDGPKDVKLRKSGQVFLRDVSAANYEIESENGNAQPLLIDLEHISGTPELKALMDDEVIFISTNKINRVN